MALTSLILTLSSFAQAADRDLSHFLQPGTPMAGVDGSLSHWLNPANLAFDPDQTGALFIQGLDDIDDSTWAMTTGSDGSSFGFIHHRTSTDDRFYGLSLASGAEISDSFSLGSSAQWNWGRGRDGYLTADFGFAIRPASWLGIAGTIRNAVGRRYDTPATYSTGAVLRPLGNALQLGVDYTVATDAESLIEGTTRGIVVLEAFDGLLLRGEIDDQKVWGAGIELHFGGSGTSIFSQGLADSLTFGAITSQPSQGIGTVNSDKTPLYNLGASFGYEPSAGLFQDTRMPYLELLRRLRVSAENPNTEQIVLQTAGMSFSFAQLQEIRKILIDAKSNGKKIVCYLGQMPELGNYYLASLGDKIFMHPGGSLMFTGLGIERQYLAGTLDLVGVEAQFSQQGDYKSAVEAYTRTGASEAATEQSEALLDDLWSHMVTGIAEARGVSEEDLLAAIDGGPMTALAAKEAGWVTDLIFNDDFKREVLPNRNDLDFGGTPIEQDDSGWGNEEKIGIVYVTGPISTGRSSRGGLLGGASAGSESIAGALRRAKNNDEIKALVLRVDSPGGSAIASEDIWKAVSEVQAAGKPVVVSMGGVAASGGYYVSASADAILAEPTTITGSIGAFAGWLSFAELYDKMGVSTEFSGRGRMANMLSTAKPMDPIEWASFDALAQDVYQRFLEKVAEGREMSLEEVEEVASGRVWSGEDALEVGLVDQLGGFEEAIALAAEKAGINPDSNLQTFSPDIREDLREELFRSLGLETELSKHLPESLRTLARYEALRDEHLFMMMPYQLVVR